MTHVEPDAPSMIPAALAAMESAAAPPPRRPRSLVVSALFLLSCAACGVLVALLAGVLFRERLEPIGLLLAVTGTAGVLTSVALYQLGCGRLCDRVIVMGGGLVSTLMSSLMFLE